MKMHNRDVGTGGTRRANTPPHFGRLVNLRTATDIDGSLPNRFLKN